MTCEGCGCTDDNACFDEVLEEPCHWVAPRLCSVCAREALEEPAAELHAPPAAPALLFDAYGVKIR